MKSLRFALAPIALACALPAAAQVAAFAGIHAALSQC